MAYQIGNKKGEPPKQEDKPHKTVKEKEILKKFVIPISDSQDFDLTCDDDAAVIEFPAGRQIVVTSDVIIEGIHFLSSDPPESVAKKAIRVNLSDLAAMGAHPIGYTLCLTIGPIFDESWMSKFVEGLAEDNQYYHISLIGGDISRGHGPIHITGTAIGDVAEGQALTRSMAQPGDRIYVTGTIGDAALGLQVAEGKFSHLKEEMRHYLLTRYQIPMSRHILGQSLVQVAHAATDVSDGLLMDLGLICEASKLKAYVRIDRIPLSRPAKYIVNHADEADRGTIWQTILAGGDDYELIFTAGPGESEHIDYLAKRHKIPITCIGHLGALPELDEQVEDVSLVTLLDEDGHEIQIKTQGYQHEWIIA